MVNLEGASNKVSDEIQFILNEIFRQEKAIKQTIDNLLTQKIDSSVVRTLQDLIAVNRNLVSRVDVVIKKDMKDEEILRILQESEKETDVIRLKHMELEEENEALRKQAKKFSSRRTSKAKKGSENRLTTDEDAKDDNKERPKFATGHDDQKTISDIEADNDVRVLHKYHFKLILAISFCAKISNSS